MIARSMHNRLLLSLLLAAIPAAAQLPAPNAAGVPAGHDFFCFHDIDAANKFWTNWATNERSVAGFLAYLVAHDAHHRGQITRPARQVAHPIPQSVMFGMWEWGTR